MLFETLIFLLALFVYISMYLLGASLVVNWLFDVSDADEGMLFVTLALIYR